MLCLAIGLGSMAQNKIQFRSADKAECVKSDMTSLKATFSFSGLEAQQVVTERGAFSELSMSNTVIGGNEGDPQIPVVNELIAVPVGANPTITVTSYSSTDYKLNELDIDRLVPRQPSLRKDKQPESVPFVMNEAAYQTRGMRSEPQATVQVVGTMRGVQLGKMTIEPVSYDPVNNTLRVFNNIEVEVSFNGADAKATEQKLVDTYSPYFDIVYKQLFNGRAVLDAYTAHPDLYKVPVKMLVVATSAYQSSTAFQNWLTWKKQKGIDVDIYTVTSSTASSTIQSEIYSRYNANHPTFLVIVGDETVVKAYKTNWSCGSSYGNCINDLEYASVDGDVYHDMFMSRMSVSSTTELGNLVNKILTYEKYTMSDPSYLNNSLLVAGWDASWTNRVGKPTIQYANNNYYNSAHGINPTVYITTATGQTAAYNNINNVGFMNYTAHGDIQELADPEFTNSNANSMTNNDKYLWVVANCCLSANWGNSSYSPCLGETMIRAANKGAFGYIGSIPESYWYEDYYFGVGAFSYVASTVQTPSSTTTGMYDAAFDDTGFNTLNSMPYIGNVAVTYAHAAGYTSSVTDEYYWRAYQCLGDGSVMPYLNKPSANSVSHASTINIGATSFQVNAHPGSYVAITKNNEILGVAQTNTSGIANVEISGLTSAGDVMIVVTRNQRQPYIQTIQAVAVNGPYITLDSYTPNNALVNQSTNLSLTFKNVGNAATSGNTTVTLTGDNNVTINTPTKTFSSLAVNATTTVSGFSFTIKPSATVGSTVTLHYKATNGSNTWEGDLAVTANQIYTVTATSNNTTYGTVSGGGQFNYGESCTVTATPANGCILTSWTSNGSIVSTNATYTFNVTADMDLVANFTQTVEIGTASTTNSYLPTYNYYNYSFTEQIYTAQEIGTAGTIKSIAFYNGGTAKTRTLDVYVKSTTKSTFSSKTDWVSMSASNKVFSGTVTFTASAWTFINFTTPFEYDGTSNIIIAVDDNTGEYTSSPHMACSVFNASNQAIYIYSDGTNYTPSSPTTSQSSNYALLSVKNHIIIGIEANTASSYDITVSANPTNGGTVTGAGTYDTGTTATLTATANTGYTFTNWTKNGIAVSSNATYSFTVSAASSGAYVANFKINSYNVTATANPTEGGSVTVGSSKGNRDDLVYDFENGWQGWTTFQGNTTSPNSWMHNTSYPTSNNNFTTGYGYNNSDGFMLSESYISGTSSGAGTAVTPDNYLVSPQVRLGGSISFYAGARNTSYCAEKFSVMVSTTGNTNATNFTTVATWTLSLSSAGYNSAPYTVDLSEYSGMGYVAIRHHDCYDQWFLAVDNITIVEGEDNSSDGGSFNHGQTCVVTATPNTDYHFVNWTENGTAVSSDATYSFTVTGNRDLVANFSETLPTYYAVNVTVNPANAGTVTGADSYVEGSTATLTATANDGYTFVNWTENGTEVSTETTYSFTVTADHTLVANFEEVIPIVEQTVTLNQGWNWWSTSFDSNAATLLSQMQQALGGNGIRIQSQTNGYSSYADGAWSGQLSGIDVTKMYKVNMASASTVTLSGQPVDPSQCTITLRKGNNWIGYPLTQPTDINTALANLSAADNDIVKDPDNSSFYLSGTWYGTLNTLEPGHGYVYQSTASGSKTFTYAASRNGNVINNASDANNHWSAERRRYSNNMVVLATVMIDGVQQGSDVEVAAFVNGECRGSVKLLYVEPIQQHLAILTVSGNDGETVSFKAFANGQAVDLQETLNLKTDGVVGHAENPFVLHNAAELTLFPNPASKEERIRVDLPYWIERTGAKVEVYNALGALVASETVNGNVTELQGFKVTGLYTIKVTDQLGNTCYGKLVVK